jgi:hypothetical protein
MRVKTTQQQQQRELLSFYQQGRISLSFSHSLVTYISCEFVLGKCGIAEWMVNNGRKFCCHQRRGFVVKISCEVFNILAHVCVFI